MKNIEFLSEKDVENIHNSLVIDAANSNDPIFPPGVKSQNLLISAVSRQTVGIGDKLKYDDPISNAATLCYGICCNHPLHNGNKRTALVSLLCHLDKNGITFTDKATQEILYSFMLKIAGHSLVPKKKLKKVHDHSDMEIAMMTEWIRRRTRKIAKGERSLSYPELERLLAHHDLHFENHRNNTVEVVRYQTKVKYKGFWRKGEQVETRDRVATIPYWPGRTVGKNLTKSIRKQAGLTHQNGFDSAMFYGNETSPDDFIQKYKKVLSRLAKT